MCGFMKKISNKGFVWFSLSIMSFLRIQFIGSEAELVFVLPPGVQVSLIEQVYANQTVSPWIRGEY